jgi:hypothetical protein
MDQNPKNAAFADEAAETQRLQRFRAFHAI